MPRFHVRITTLFAFGRAKLLRLAPRVLSHNQQEPGSRSAPIMNKRSLVIASVLGAAAFWTVSRVWAFNPQPDPPAMAAIQMLSSETVRLYAHCSAQAVRGVNPGPCAVALLFRDDQGNVLKATPAPLALRPGQTGVLELHGNEIARSAPGMVVAPEAWPDQSARVVMSVQVVDSLTGKTSLYSVSAAPRLSFFATE